MSNGFKLFLGAFFSFSALILAIVACAGSTKNYDPINRIYTYRIDLSSVNPSVILPSLAGQSGFDNTIPEYINVGIWSYCAVDSSGDVRWCSSPRAIQDYDLQEFIFDSIESDGGLDGIALSESGISVPSLDGLGRFHDLQECMFITLIIGIVITFLNLMVNLLRWVIHVRFLDWLGSLLSFLGFIALIVCAGTGTGAYVWLRDQLDRDDTWSISINLGRTFFGLLWGAVAAALFNFIAWCTVRPKRQVAYAVPAEKRTLM